MSSQTESKADMVRRIAEFHLKTMTDSQMRAMIRRQLEDHYSRLDENQLKAEFYCMCKDAF